MGEPGKHSCLAHRVPTVSSSAAPSGLCWRHFIRWSRTHALESDSLGLNPASTTKWTIHLPSISLSFPICRVGINHSHFIWRLQRVSETLAAVLEPLSQDLGSSSGSVSHILAGGLGTLMSLGLGVCICKMVTIQVLTWCGFSED